MLVWEFAPLERGVKVQGITENKNIRIINDVENNLNKTIDCFNIEDFNLLLREMYISSANFRNQKAYIKKYIVDKYGEQAPSIKILENIYFDDIDILGVYRAKYFKNFNHLCNEIDSLLTKEDPDAIESNNLALACIYLAWIGVPQKITPDILKSSVLNDDDFVIMPNGKYLEAPSRAINFLRYYRDAAYYTRIVNGYVGCYAYADTKYLLRTNKTGYIPYSKIAVKVIYFKNKFKTLAPFQYSNIYQSGIFSRFRAYEIKNGRLPDIIPGCKYSNDIIKQYENALCIKFKSYEKLRTDIKEYRTWEKAWYND